MSIEGLFKIFRPKQHVFFELPEKMTANLIQLSEHLKLIIQDIAVTEDSQAIQRVGKLEQDTNDLSRDVFQALNVNFITPFDREDIYHLAGALREVNSYLASCCRKILKYRFVQQIEGYGIMADIIIESCTSLHHAVAGLRNLNKQAIITSAIQLVRKAEREADDIYYVQVEKLFDGELKTNELIKAAEIYQLLESVTDKSYEASKRIQGILVKTA